MIITKEMLEEKINNIREKGKQANAMLQQIIGAESILIEVLADLNKEEDEHLGSIPEYFEDK